MTGTGKGPSIAQLRAMPAVSAEDMLRHEFGSVVPVPGIDWNDRGQKLPDLIAKLQSSSGDRRPEALCLSGGGIRSATFSLGVMQWLAGNGKLRDFHYLSSVSGGGYTAGFVVNGLRQAHKMGSDVAAASGADAKAAELAGQAHAEEWVRRLGQSAGADHAAGTAGAARITDGGGDPVAPLRAYSNYLSPTGGLSTDAFALVAIFLRNLLLNLLIWLPLLAVAVALPRIYIALLDDSPPLGLSGLPIAQSTMVVLVLIVIGIAYIVADLPAPSVPQAVKTGSPPPPTAALVAARSPSDRFKWFCFVPITSAAVLLSLFGAWASELRALEAWKFALAGAIAHGLGIVIGVPLRLKVRKLGKRPASGAGVFVVILVGLIGGALASLVVSQVGTEGGPSNISAMQRLLYATLAVPAMTGAFWLAMALHAGFLGRVTTEQDREWWARATAAWLKFTVFWLLAFGLVVWAPVLILDHAAEAGLTAAKFGIGGSALGVVTALVGYWSKHGTKVSAGAKSFLRATGANLLNVMAGLVLLSVLLALSLSWNVLLERCHDWGASKRLCTVDIRAETDFLREQIGFGAAAGSAGGANVLVMPLDPDPTPVQIAELGGSAGPQVYAYVLLRASGWMVVAMCCLLLSLPWILSRCMGANQFTLHGMYGNRLIRAFLGSGRPQRRPHWFTGFDQEDNPKMHELHAPLSVGGAPRLFPVVNMALNLVKPSQKRLDWQQRKAASFFASPLHCGSAHLGFRPAEYYVDGMSLGRAMTISGAAASPNMGYHSAGLVTLVMTLFNVRLGWWSPHPTVNPEWFRDHPAIGLKILFAEAGGATGDEDPYAYLSDGGHFDNTGIYEMVRRRCKRIVVVDATCDGEFKWNDLLDTVRKIRVDFGVPIDLHGELPGGGREPKHPRCLRGTIRYSSRDPAIQDGELIVLKPILQPEDPPELAAYARDSAKEGSAEDDPKRFPHQSTSDQFYDEQQFESYRLLGYVTARDALGSPPPPTVPITPPTRSRRPVPVVIADSEDGSVTTGSGAFGSVGELVQQMGTSMALATAVTIGGALGVVGTAALQSSEVSLSAEDRDLLKKGVTSQIGLSESDRQALKDGLRITLDQQSVKQLTMSVTDLQAVIKSLSNVTGPTVTTRTLSTVSLDKQARTAIEQLNTSIDKATAPESNPASPGSMKELADAVTALKVALNDLPRNEQVSKTLDSAIGTLSNKMESSAPRRNIRGQEGGSR